jgi:hypothetical protein
MCVMNQSNLVQGGKVVASIAGPTFGLCEFATPENAGVYENRSGKSTMAANVKVPITGIGLVVAATVYGDLDKDGKVIFRTSLPRGITATDAVREEFKRHVKAGLSKWSAFNSAARAAYGRLTAVKAADNPDAPLVYDPTADKPGQSAKADETEPVFDPAAEPEPETAAEPEAASAEPEPVAGSQRNRARR